MCTQDYLYSVEQVDCTIPYIKTKYTFLLSSLMCFLRIYQNTLVTSISISNKEPIKPSRKILSIWVYERICWLLCLIIHILITNHMELGESNLIFYPSHKIIQILGILNGNAIRFTFPVVKMCSNNWKWFHLTRLH